MGSDVRIRIPDHVMVREVAGESVLLDLETEKYFGLDEIGTAVLRHFAAGATLAEAVDRIVEVYDASSKQVTSDVAALVDSLVARGLVSTVVDKR